MSLEKYLNYNVLLIFFRLNFDFLKLFTKILKTKNYKKKVFIIVFNLLLS